VSDRRFTVPDWYAEGFVSPKTWCLAVFLAISLSCSADPTVILPPVPAAWGGLECVGRALDERGYDVQVSSRDASVLSAERRRGRLGGGARREFIQVRRVADKDGVSLRTRVWAVAYYEGFSESLRQNAVVTEASQETLADAQAALEGCRPR